MGKLFALFVVVPLVEVYLLYALGSVMGFWPTLALVMGTALLGAALGKREGLRVWRQWREALAEGRMPEEGILGGVLVLVGAVLLVAPGVLTDIAGLVLILAPTRRIVAKLVQKRLEKSIAEGRTRMHYRVELGNADVLRDFHGHVGRSAAHGDVVDTVGEVIEERRRGDAKAHLTP